MVLLLQPATLAPVQGVVFEGNRAVASDILLKALSRFVLGSGYTERSFRSAIELNLRPLYEQLGRLRAGFPSVTAISSGAGVQVKVSIEEGAVYRLGEVRVSGEDLPQEEMLRAAAFRRGEVADWRKITQSISGMERVLRGRGHLAASSRPERRFNDEASAVDLDIAVRKGPQFQFGELVLVGLAPDAEKRGRREFKLRPGDVLDEPYLDEFLKVFADTLNGGGSVSQELTVRPGTTTVDVKFTFRTR